MPEEGEIRNVDGKLYRWVPRQVAPKAVTGLSETVSQSAPIIGEFLRLFEWKGVYQAFDETIDSGTMSSVYDFGFPARHVVIQVDHNVLLRLNSPANPYIQLDVTESPFTLGPLYPNMLIDRIFVDTKGSSTRIKILAAG